MLLIILAYYIIRSHYLQDEVLGPVLRYVRSAATMFKLENLLSDFHIHPDIHLRITLGIITGIIDWASARASFAEEDFSPLELDEWSNESKLK